MSKSNLFNTAHSSPAHFPSFYQYGLQQCGQLHYVSWVNGDLPAVELRSPQKQPCGSWPQHHFQIQRQGSPCFSLFCCYSSHHDTDFPNSTKLMCWLISGLWLSFRSTGCLHRRLWELPWEQQVIARKTSCATEPVLYSKQTQIKLT